MIEFYANQTLAWGKAGPPDMYNEPTYTNTTIKGRKQSGFRLVRNASGQEVVSTGVVYTSANISEGDKIDGRLIIALGDAVGLGGEVEYKKGFLT